MIKNSAASLEKEQKDNIIAIVSIFTVPFLNTVYTLLNGTDREAYNLVTPLDMRIPFVRQFILPYNMWYPFILTALLYLCLKNRAVYYKAIISIDIGLVCCYLVYIICQTTIVRPEVTGSDIFSRLVRLTYSLDKPYNCLPSIHVLTSYLVMKAFSRSSLEKAACFTAYLIGCTIIISTVMVKQHVVVDIAAAVVLGEVVFYVASFINEERLIGWIKKLFSSLMMRRKLET